MIYLLLLFIQTPPPPPIPPPPVEPMVEISVCDTLDHLPPGVTEQVMPPVPVDYSHCLEELVVVDDEYEIVESSVEPFEPVIAGRLANTPPELIRTRFQFWWQVRK